MRITKLATFCKSFFSFQTLDPEYMVHIGSGCYCNDSFICNAGNVCFENKCMQPCEDMETLTTFDGDCYCNQTASICSSGEICATSGCQVICPATPEVFNGTGSCLCKDTSCNPEQICIFDNSSCVAPCPSKYFDTTTYVATKHPDPCFCNTTFDTCDPEEICGADGCLSDCPLNSFIEVDKQCYCNDSFICNSGEVCKNGHCYLSCPHVSITIETDCFCNFSNSVCSNGKICNDRHKERVHKKVH